MKYSLQSAVKLLYLFDIFVQGQSKVLAIISAIIRSMQCSNKKLGQDFDRGRRSEYKAYASDTPLKKADRDPPDLFSLLPNKNGKKFGMRLYNMCTINIKMLHIYSAIVNKQNIQRLCGIFPLL